MCLHITLEILSTLAEALSTAAEIYPDPLPLDISDGFKVTFTTAVLCVCLPEILLTIVTKYAYCDYVNFPLSLLAALQNLVSTCGDHQNPLGKHMQIGLDRAPSPICICLPRGF